MNNNMLTTMFQRFSTERSTKIETTLEIMKNNFKIVPIKCIVTINSLSEISTIPKMLQEHDAVVFKSFLKKNEIAKMLESIDENRNLLIKYSEDYQVLGRVWSSDYIMDNAEEYFEKSTSSREVVQNVLPNIEDKLLNLCKKYIFKDDNVIIREGFCGPAVVFFSPNKEAKFYGGDIHIDWEGLELEHVQEGIPCYSFVCMLSLPEEHGGTGVWNVEFEYNSNDASTEKVQKTVVNYEIGDFAMFSSFKLHNIETIVGKGNRATLIFHVAYIDGYWKIWF